MITYKDTNTTIDWKMLGHWTKQKNYRQNHSILSPAGSLWKRGKEMDRGWWVKPTGMVGWLRSFLTYSKQTSLHSHSTYKVSTFA